MAYDAEMSRATVNRHLDVLEGLALVRRVPRICPRTKRQLSTTYELAFDHDFSVSQNETQPASQIETRAVSQKSQKPCLNSGDSRVSNCDTNLGIEPGREPCASEADPQTNDLPSGFWDRFAKAYPRIGNRKKTEAALLAAMKAGADPDTIILGARAYALEQKGNETRYVAYSENWAEQSRWEQFTPAPKPPVDETASLQGWADLIKQGQRWVAGHVNAALASTLISGGLVTEAQCRSVGIQL